MVELVIFSLKEKENGRCSIQVNRRNNLISSLINEIEVENIYEAISLIEELKNAPVEIEYMGCKYYRS